MRRHVVLAFLVGLALGIAFVAIALLAIGTVAVGMTAMVARFGPGDGKTISGYKRAAEAQALNVLSAAQKVKWQAMKGAKFTPPKGK